MCETRRIGDCAACKNPSSVVEYTVDGKCVRECEVYGEGETEYVGTTSTLDGLTGFFSASALQ